ncbi:hypothetical protein GCM10010954_11930 [Halobacillus andaensis]|uniref:DUF3953 domain-containing protein n=1 Tax=Halobacillus andaensis TaxID=1176239 RepID=A0A917EW64_HALAA|nr:DUF3953 domain-containing protein [Halobacillus andaensis]MBP2003990.1 putative membrane channel-forming protein YqfA (hemolysin III family) [Halobacillus andaensis]GGF14949.1 hypothetical protein GCM10010954_11930 [Halobacillus andaensis]
MGKLRIGLAGIVVILGGYGLMAGDTSLSPLMLFIVGLLLLTVGFIELEKDKKSFWAYSSFAIAAFVFFVSSYTLFS